MALVPSPLIPLVFSTAGISTPISCQLARPVECSCIFGSKFNKNFQQLRKMERKLVDIMERVSFMREFHSDNFTVVYQPFFKDASVYYQSDKKPDMSMLSVDCFHLSQKGHAISANGIWNNLMEPVGKKSNGFTHLFEKFHCPTMRNPFIFTNYNTLNLI